MLIIILLQLPHSLLLSYSALPRTSREDVQRRRFQRVERRRDECRIQICGATDPERPITGPTSGKGRPGS